MIKKNSPLSSSRKSKQREPQSQQRRAVCKPPDPAHAHPHDDNVSILDCALRSKISSFYMEGSGLWEWDHYEEERADKSGCQSAVKVNPTGYFALWYKAAFSSVLDTLIFNVTKLQFILTSFTFLSFNRRIETIISWVHLVVFRFVDKLQNLRVFKNIKQFLT